MCIDVYVDCISYTFGCVVIIYRLSMSASIVHHHHHHHSHHHCFIITTITMISIIFIRYNIFVIIISYNIIITIIIITFSLSSSSSLSSTHHILRLLVIHRQFEALELTLGRSSCQFKLRASVVCLLQSHTQVLLVILETTLRLAQLVDTLLKYTKYIMHKFHLSTFLSF